MKNKKIYALAAFLYLFLSPFFFHPGLKIIFYQSQFLTHGVVNIYQFLQVNPDKAFSGPFVYPPLAYFFVGILFPFVNLIAGSGFVRWLAMGNDAVGVAHIYRYIFAIKLPFIIFLFLTAHIFENWIKDEALKRKFLILWFFNPISIYVVALTGQIDIVAVFLTVAALYFAEKKPNLSATLLGLGAAFKTYPILLLPFFSILTNGSWRKRITNLAVGLFCYLIFIIPFLKTSAFYSDTLTSGLSQRLLEFNINLGFGETLSITPIILLVLFLGILSKEQVKSKLVWYFFIITSLVVMFTHFHPQWGMWSLPFLIYAVISLKDINIEQKWVSLSLYFVGFLGTIFLFEDIFLTFGIFSPMDPDVYFLSTPASLLQKIINPLVLQSVFHSMAAGVVMWLAYKYFSVKKDHE